MTRALAAGGTSAWVLLTASNTPVVDTAGRHHGPTTYSIASSANLTGEATAIIGQDGNASDATFTMDGRPCTP
jgi:hypothetical protein